MGQGKNKAKEVAKQYLASQYESTKIQIKGMMLIAFQEYERRIDSVAHYDERYKEDTCNRIALRIGEEFGFNAERRMMAVEIKEDGEIIYQPHLILGMDTEYLYYQTVNGKDIKCELNKNAEVLIGLIHTIIAGE